MPNTPTAPGAEAFHVERIVDPFTGEDVVGMVRHAGRPVVYPLSVMPDDNYAQFLAIAQAIALDYLNSLAALAGLHADEWIHPDILARLGPGATGDPCEFGWLPVTWGYQPPPEQHRRPVGSFWADRGNDDVVTAWPRLLVLLAGSVDTSHQLQAGGDMGLRIVMHVRPGEMRIHGVTLSGLTTRRALDVIPELRSTDNIVFDLIKDVRPAIAKALGCDSAWVNNLERATRPGSPADRLIATGLALRTPKDKKLAQDKTRMRTYDYRVELSVDPTPPGVQVVQIHRDLVIGSGVLSGSDELEDTSTRVIAFVQDAASQGPPETLALRRPTRSDEELAQFRAAVNIALPLDQALLFIDDSDTTIFETRVARARNDIRPGSSTVPSNAAGVVTVMAPADDDDAQPVRSDAQGCIDAYVRKAELTARLQAFGFDSNIYFKFACLPLVPRVRPPMRWAPDGELPDAEVRPFLKGGLGSIEIDGTTQRPSDPLQLMVNYGSADPLHRRKLPLLPGGNGGGVDPDILKAQYLSVASDPRWAWHEFSHVLSFASTGELEFPFAHSAGDALGAIVADPLSKLATAGNPDAEIRHVTYPWIEVPGRSHGRSALGGYCWCGRRNTVRLDFDASLERYHHTYFGEQIMSSSLFRLYRSLGGDTLGPNSQPGDDDEKMRLSASDYCVYLIMRGIMLLGPDSLAPARTPDQFVSALIEADLGTDAWDVDATWPFIRDPRTMNRRGGRVHKVIRWAFQQQGLYATDNPRLTAEGPGSPPKVDTFIADRARSDGGYAPLPLRMGGEQDWYAAGNWVWREGTELHVRVDNCGAHDAVQTGLRVWWAAASYQALDWQPVTTPIPPQDIAGAGSTVFQLTLPAEALAQPSWVFVSVDAPADPSNLPDDTLPPASGEGLLELVAHDNNLALAPLY